MSSVSEKRTSLEYGFRPAINPSQSFQDFIRNVPDQAIHDQWPQKHSEFKKPYFADSYQDMDYIWEKRPLFSLPDYPVPGPPPSPYFPAPRVPKPPAPPPGVPSPGDDPPGWIFIDRKCCGHGLRLSGASTVAPEGVVTITVSGGNPSCEYRVKADIGSFDTWYGMDFVGGGSASFDWKAPNSPGETAKITIEPYYSNWSLEACLELSIAIAGCGTSHIDYTTQQMAVNETQNLSVGDPTSGVTYTWEVTSGGGSLDPLTGTSTTYTAPATNAECASNPTITLKSGTETCDTLKIAVDAGGTGYRAYENKWLTGVYGPCCAYIGYSCADGATPPDCLPPVNYCGETTYFDCAQYYCNGNLIRSCGGSSFVCRYVSPAGVWEVKGYCTANPGAAICGQNYPLGITDVRSAAAKTAGCCPAQLL